MDTETHPIKEAALRYIERGFRVIPLNTAYNLTCSCKQGKTCGSMGKHPIRFDWQKGNNPGGPAIDNWWTGEKPRNIGIVTGPDSNLLVLDVDGDKGQESLKALIAEHGPIPRTKMVKTGSGGYHFYFTYPDFEVGNTASTKLGKGLDTRGKGGFVVAPPSVSGVRDVKDGPVRPGPYSDVESRGEDIVAAPDWLLELLRPKARKPVVTTEAEKATIPAGNTAEQQRLDGYVKGAIDIEVGRLKELTEKGWDGPPWDITTFEVACNLIQLANAPWSSLEPDYVYNLVFDNAPRDPGFDNDRIDAKIQSARSTVGDNETPYPQKTSAAFWLEDEEELLQGLSYDNRSGNAELKPEASEPAGEVDDFMADATADDAPPPASIGGILTMHGIPVAGNTLMPNLIEVAKAQALGTTYRAREHVEMEILEDEIDLDILVAEPVIPDGQLPDSEVARDWVVRNLRSATPELLWAAVATLVAGVDTDAPVFVFKGGGPLLALLARTLDARPGDADEMLLAGPRISTKAGHEREIVFEFADEPIDLMPYARALVDIAATTPSITEWPIDHAEHDDLEDIEDYRVAQLHRARRGLGSKPRDPDGDL